MFTRLGSSDGNFGVQVMGKANVNSVNIVTGYNFAVVGGHKFRTQLLCSLFSKFSPLIAAGNNFKQVRRLQITSCMSP